MCDKLNTQSCAQPYADHLKWKDVPQDEKLPDPKKAGNARVENFSKELKFRNPSDTDKFLKFDLQASYANRKVHGVSFTGGAGSRVTARLNKDSNRLAGTFDALLKSNGIVGGYNAVYEMPVDKSNHLQAAIDIIGSAKYYAGVDEVGTGSHPIETGLYTYAKFNDSISYHQTELAEHAEKGGFKISTDRINDEIITKTAENFDSEVSYVSYLAKKAKNRPAEMTEQNWDDLRDKTAALDSMLGNEKFMARARELGVAPKEDGEHNAALYLAYNAIGLEDAKEYGFKHEYVKYNISKAAHYGDLGKVKTDAGYFVSYGSINNRMLSKYSTWSSENPDKAIEYKDEPKPKKAPEKKDFSDYVAGAWDYLKEAAS